MASILKIPKIARISATKRHTATLFIFHGSGSTGDDIKEWIDILNRDEFKFPHIKVIYPTAPLQPYTPLGGMLSNVWFDRQDIMINVPEVKESLDVMCNLTSELIDNEVQSGVDIGRIMVSGFSMGGALAMHLSYRYRTSLAGCVAMSSFLNDNSLVYEALRKYDSTNKLPPLLQFHGLKDTLVPFAWGEMTHKTLSRLNVDSKLIPLPEAEHELIRSEIQQFKDQIVKLLPDTE